MNVLGIVDNYARKVGHIVPEWLVALSLRLGIFFVFWKSAQTKISGLTVADQHFAFWNVTDSTIMLFEYEYDLPLLPPEIAAYLASFGEFFLALGILLGFMTRLSALGLLIMTTVIQFLVYPESWSNHLLWAAMLLYLLRNGGGLVALDRLFKAS